MIKIKVAGHVFGLENKYDFVRFMCRDYLCDDEPEIVFTLSDDDLAAFNTYSKPETQEYYALHGKIATYMLLQDTLLFHGSCLALDGNGILFTAPSGTGKSTHAQLWRERFGERVTMINDDKPLIKFEKPRITGLHGKSVVDCVVYGSPWCGKEGIHTNTCAPLRCIVVLRQAAVNTICRLSQKEATIQFLHQALIPSDDMAMRLKALDLIGRLSTLPVYELSCTISQEAVDLFYTALRDCITQRNTRNQ